MLRFAALGTAKRNTASKRKTMLRFADPYLRCVSYAVRVMITVFLFALICYVLRYVFTFWEMLRFAALHGATHKITRRNTPIDTMTNTKMRDVFTP